MVSRHLLASLALAAALSAAVGCKNELQQLLDRWREEDASRPPGEHYEQGYEDALDCVEDRGLSACRSGW
jgi:hypothetical protein